MKYKIGRTIAPPIFIISWSYFSWLKQNLNKYLISASMMEADRGEAKQRYSLLMNRKNPDFLLTAMGKGSLSASLT